MLSQIRYKSYGSYKQNSFDHYSISDQHFKQILYTTLPCRIFRSAWANLAIEVGLHENQLEGAIQLELKYYKNTE